VIYVNSAFPTQAVIHEFSVGGSACYDPDGVREVRVGDRCHEWYGILMTYASDLVPKITCQVGEPPGLYTASGFEHPASTLPTRFPVALGIGHGLPAA